VRYFPLFLLLSCAAPHGPWLVYQGTAEQQAQADFVLSVARSVTNAPLDVGGWIVMAPDLDGACPSPEGYAHISGCNFGTVIYIRVDGARFPDVLHSALGHEFCHVGLRAADGPQVQACELLVTAEYWRY